MRNGFKISFCTVVKNRLSHIKKTLKSNIEDNSDFENLEFLILDYNSSDGLEEWLKYELANEIITRRLVYYKIPSVEYFQRSHSRNAAFMLATGTVLCNIDADNFTGKHFAKYINNEFLKNENILLTPYGSTNPVTADLLGRLCCKKSDFLLTNGYDENMMGYGFEDLDLINRLTFLGLEKVLIKDKKFLKAIPHSDVDRIKEENLLKQILSVYISHSTPFKSYILMLCYDNSFVLGCIIDNRNPTTTDLFKSMSSNNPKYSYILKNKKWTKGIWHETEGHITFKTNKTIYQSKFESSNKINIKNRKYFKILDERLLVDILMFYSQFSNRNKMNNNFKRRKPSLTQNPGKGVYHRNFDYFNCINIDQGNIS